MLFLSQVKTVKKLRKVFGPSLNGQTHEKEYEIMTRDSSLVLV
jgi:hypothetical protein